MTQGRKTCVACRSEKPVDEFYKRHGECKACSKAARLARRPPQAAFVDLVGEEWRPVPGFPLYEVSNLGRVRTHKPLGGPSERPRQEPLLLRTRLNSHGYRRVGLRRDGANFVRTVHALVLVAFAGARPADMECRHLNGDKTDNRLVNLAWGTRAENARDLVQHGGHAGEHNWNSKLTTADVRAMRAANAPPSALAARYKICERHAADVIAGKRWRHVS